MSFENYLPPYRCWEAYGKIAGVSRGLAEICPSCNGPLMEIDHYGERLVGCIERNR
jgi:hypothetical protein